MKNIQHITDFDMKFREPAKAFEHAIKQNVFSSDARRSNYAGLYMYMYTDGKYDVFKHIMSRREKTVYNDALI